MRFLGLLGLAVIALGCLTPSSSQAQSAIDNPIVIELYTSRFCAFCPKAEDQLEAFSQKFRQVIPIACHVDYFNGSDGDPFARNYCSARQSSYAKRMAQGARFTPMVVSSGNNLILGNTEANAWKLYEQRMSQSIVKPVYIKGSIATQGQYQIILPRIAQGDYTVLVGFVQQPTVAMNNRMEPRTYTNALSYLARLDSWDGSSKALKTTLPTPANSQKIVILVQSHDQTIVAAGQLLL